MWLFEIEVLFFELALDFFWTWSYGFWTWSWFFLNLKLRFLNLVLSFLNLTLRFLNLLLRFLNLKLRFLNLVLSFLNLKLRFLNLVLTFLNLKLRFLNLVLSFLNLKLQFLNLVLTFLNLKLKWCSAFSRVWSCCWLAEGEIDLRSKDEMRWGWRGKWSGPTGGQRGDGQRREWGLRVKGIKAEEATDRRTEAALSGIELPGVGPPTYPGGGGQLKRWATVWSVEWQVGSSAQSTEWR